MGLTKVTVKLSNPAAPKRSYETLFLVDTGATDCVAPAGELRKIGVSTKAVCLTNSQMAR